MKVITTRVGLAAIRDAVERIREALPPEAAAADRTAREVVILNLFVAVQECLSIAVHWLADTGSGVPGGYREVYLVLAEQGVLTPELAGRLGIAAGLRNLIAHRYGALDWSRIHEIASRDLDDLLSFCEAVAIAAERR